MKLPPATQKKIMKGLALERIKTKKPGGGRDDCVMADKREKFKSREFWDGSINMAIHGVQHFSESALKTMDTLYEQVRAMESYSRHFLNNIRGFQKAIDKEVSENYVRVSPVEAGELPKSNILKFPEPEYVEGI